MNSVVEFRLHTPFEIQTVAKDALAGFLSESAEHALTDGTDGLVVAEKRFGSEYFDADGDFDATKLDVRSLLHELGFRPVGDPEVCGYQSPWNGTDFGLVGSAERF